MERGSIMSETLKKLLAPFQNKYYKVFNSGSESDAKLLEAPLGKKLAAKTWHVYPQGNVNGGFVVAKRHPLFFHHLWGSPVPVTYFEVAVNNPVPPIQRCDFTYWAREIIKIRELTANSPEFNQELLALMATTNEATIVREYAVELIDPVNHALLRKIAEQDSSPNVCGRAIQKFPVGLYKDFLRTVLLDKNQKYNNGAMRVYALEKLDPKTDHQLIAETAEKGGEDWIRVLATEKVNGKLYPDLILCLSRQKTTVGDIQDAAIKKLDPIKHRKRLIEIIQQTPTHLFNQYKVVEAAKLLIKGLQPQAT